MAPKVYGKLLTTHRRGLGDLMSVSMLCDLDMVVIFGKYRCVVIMEAYHSIVFEGFKRGDLYIVDFSTGPQPATCLLAKASEGCLWHR